MARQRIVNGGHSFLMNAGKDDLLTYNEVQDLLIKGESPLKSWRRFRGVTKGEIAAAFDMTEESYAEFEKKGTVNQGHLKGMLWYLDIHPLECFPSGAIFTDKSDYLHALIDAHNNPEEWPDDSEDRREATATQLRQFSSREFSYDYLVAQRNIMAKGHSLINTPLVQALDLMLVNDGNPYYEGNTGMNPLTQTSTGLLRTIVSWEAELKRHEATFPEQKKTLKRKGEFVFSDRWDDVHAMVDRFYSPKHTADVYDFLRNDVPGKTRRVPPLKDDNFKEVAQAYIAFKEGERFEGQKTPLLNRLLIASRQREVVLKFSRSHDVFLKAYANRQAMLLQTEGLLQPMGNVEHPLYARPQLRAPVQPLRFGRLTP